MMGRGKDNPVEKAEPGILHQILTNVDKRTPGTVDEHDDKQHWRWHAQQNADRGTDQISIWCFQEEMSVGHRKIHGFRGMMGGMQAPQNPDLVRQKMINKMRKLPYNVPINKPVPGKFKLK